MADMQLVLKLIAEAQSAVAGLKSVTAAVKETGTEAVKVEGDARGMGVVIVQAGDQSAAAVEALSTKLATAQARIEALGREIAGLKSLPPATIPDTERFGKAAGEASRQAGYMAAQWNDMVMMALAGQNPMQLAIQQGSQITQAFGPGGASGALRSVGAGFMAMLSPMNLATYAAIALGTTLVQWLMSSAEAAETTDDKLKTLGETVDSLASMARSAGEPIDQLRDKYGNLAVAIQNARLEALKQQTETAKTNLNDALDASIFASAPFAEVDINGLDEMVAQIDALKAKIAQAREEARQKDVFYDDTADQDALNRLTQKAQNVASYIGAIADQLRVTRAEAADILVAVDQVRNAASDPRAQVTAANNLLVLLQGIGSTDEAMIEVTKALSEAIQRGGDLAVVATDIEKGLAGSSAAIEKANAGLREQIEQLNTEAAIRLAIQKYGEDSVVVANMKLAAERDAAHQLILAGEGAEDLKQQAIAAWDAAHGISSEDMFQVFQAGATAAADLEAWLKKAWDNASGIGGSDLSSGIRAAIGPAWELAKALWDGVAASNARARKNEEAGAAVRRIPGGLDALAAGDLNWSGGNWSRRLPPETQSSAGDGGGGGATDSLGSLSERASKVMQQLDDALASVDLKAKAGIMSAAEAADAVTSAKERAADELADLIPELERLGPSGAKAAETWRAAFGDLAEELKGVGGAIGELSADLSSGFKAPFADFIAGTKSGADAWDDFVGNLNRTISQKLSNKFVDSLLGPALDGLLGGLGMSFFADGGVPGISDLSGQVLNQPTLFAMPGGGLGEMAEAGPEAIMPLKQGPGGLSVLAISGGRETLLGLTRASDGKLGVQLPDYQPADWNDPAVIAPRRFANGGVIGSQTAAQELVTSRGAPGAGGASGMGPGGQISSTIIINNTVPEAAPTVKERFEGNNRITTIMIDAVRDALADDLSSGRGPVPPALEQAFGLARRGR